MKKHNIRLGVAFFALALLASCGRDSHISVSQDRFFFEKGGGEAQLVITADGDWSIEKDEGASWISVSPYQGSRSTAVTIRATENEEPNERNTSLIVYSSKKKTQKKIYVVQDTDVDHDYLMEQIWFLRFYERWDLDYANQVIDYSYRSQTYYIDQESWFFYFTDSLGYLVHAANGDTLYSPYEYVYYPENDSLYLNFLLTTTDTVEEYFARVHELSHERFTFSNEYRRHQYEKLHNVNVGINRNSIKVNPSKIVKKAHGPLIPIK